MARKITAFLGLQCFNNDATDDITKARGYMEFFERYAHSDGLIDSALLYLGRAKDKEAKKQNRDYIRAWYLRNDYGQVAAYAAGLKAAELRDAWTAYRIGEAYFQLQHPDSALPWYRRATEIWNYSLDFQNKYGICLLAVRDVKQALSVFSFVTGQNPNHVSANTNLGYIYMQQGDSLRAGEYMSRANALDPDYEQNLLNMAVWYHGNQEPEKARRTLVHLLKKHPENERARAMLGDLSTPETPGP